MWGGARGKNAGMGWTDRVSGACSARLALGSLLTAAAFLPELVFPGSALLLPWKPRAARFPPPAPQPGSNGVPAEQGGGPHSTQQHPGTHTATPGPHSPPAPRCLTLGHPQKSLPASTACLPPYSLLPAPQALGPQLPCPAGPAALGPDLPLCKTAPLPAPTHQGTCRVSDSPLCLLQRVRPPAADTPQVR